MSSTELFDAASISMTSSDVAEAIETHESQTPHGVTVGPWMQFSDAARIFAIDVLPVPRDPTNRYAWWTLSCSTALRSVRTTCSCPTTSANVRGRWRRYSEAIFWAVYEREWTVHPSSKWVPRRVRRSSAPAGHSRC